MTRKLLDDCFLHDGQRLRHADALALLRERLAPVVGDERVRIDDAVGRFTAHGIVSRMAVPAHTNSAVDGYAIAAQAYDATAGSNLPVAMPPPGSWKVTTMVWRPRRVSCLSPLTPRSASHWTVSP